MRTVLLITLMLFISIFSKAQMDRQKYSDSVAMESRTKADLVLSRFDTIQAPKLLYSLSDRYYYLLIKGAAKYKEYYVTLDSIGQVCRIQTVQTPIRTSKQRKQQADYARLLTEAEPIFKLSRYHEDFVTSAAEVTTLDSRPVYFVIKDVAGKRYGEYRLWAFDRSPIDASLAAFLAKKLTAEMVKHDM